MPKILRLGASALVGTMSLLVGSCGDPIECGPGTRLDEATRQCRSVQNPDFNIIVDDFNIGEFAFTNTDVPEQMRPGFPDTRTFTITNTGDEDQTVTLVRVSLVPVNEHINELREAIEDIGSELGCDSDADCSVSTACDTEQLICKLNPTNIGAVVIDNLAAGEERQIEYRLALPPEFPDEGVFGLVFSVNEIVLVRNPETDEYVEDVDHPLTADEDPFARAAAVYAPATVLVGVPDKPNLRVLFASLDTSAFEVEPGSETPLLTVSGRLSAQGKNVVAPVHTRFELRLPGHVVQQPGQDLGEQYFLEEGLDFASAPATTTYVYDANRTLAVHTLSDGGDMVPQGTWQAECANDECTDRVTVPNDLGRDGTWALRLTDASVRLLGQTADRPDQNPNLDANGEIAGVLKIIVSTDEAEYEVGGNPLLSDNELSFDVVFMAAPPSAVAGDNDFEFPPDEGTGNSPLVPGPGPYPERVNFTPTWRWGVGNEWVGASAKIENYTSKQRQFGTIVAHDVVSDNFARLTVLRQNIDIVALSGTVDWGTRRAIAQNRAAGRLALFGSTYLDINYTPASQCSTEDNFETCMILGGEFRPRKNEGTPTQTERPKKRFYLNYTRSRSWYFAAGPIPIQIEVGVSAGVGMRGTIAFVQDRTTPAHTTGLQVTLGPIADAGGVAGGYVSLAVVRIGIRGTVSFVAVEFQPSVLLGLTQQIDEANDCWLKNQGQVIVKGPLSLRVLSGDIKIVAEGGIKICACFPWAGCRCASGWREIFSFTIVRISPAYSNTWNVWPVSVTNISSTAGTVCGSAPPAVAETWNSPKPSGGNYGANSNGTGNYTYTFLRASGCGELVITGSTEWAYDWLYVNDLAGNQMARLGGNINQTIPY
ncbi:MAG: hypothetical protein H0V12_06620, partial [Chloroflexi bacterium]|nr:hypothetical protein [Chloroflexota bacterium]